jgi:hypothetical protein
MGLIFDVQAGVAERLRPYLGPIATTMVMMGVCYIFWPLAHGPRGSHAGYGPPACGKESCLCLILSIAPVVRRKVGTKHLMTIGSLFDWTHS